MNTTDYFSFRVRTVRNYRRVMVLMVLAVMTLAFSTGLKAEEWYVSYDNALKEFKLKKWVNSINLFNSALKVKNQPGLNCKTYGMRFIDYTPYYYLGMAYYNLGQFENARNAFQNSSRSIEFQKGSISVEVKQKLDEIQKRFSAAATLNTPTNPQPDSLKNSRDGEKTKPVDTTKDNSNLSDSGKGLDSDLKGNKDNKEIKDNKTDSRSGSSTVSMQNPTGGAPAGNIEGGDSQSLFNLGTKYVKKGNWRDAEDMFSKSLSADPKNAEALNGLHSLAVKYLNEGIDLYFKGALLKSEEKFNEAVRILTAYKSSSKNYTMRLLSAYRFMAIVLIEKGYLDVNNSDKVHREAGEIVLKIYRLNPSYDPEARYFSPKVMKRFNELRKVRN